MAGILGEAHNPPVCDAQGNWHYNVPTDDCDRNLIKRGFDIFRGRFDGQDGYAVWNLLEILKNVRDDLSGEDFSCLDMLRCEVNGHTLGKRNCAAKLKNALITKNFIFPRGHTSYVVYACFSPDNQKIVTASWDGTSIIWDANTLQVIDTLKGHKGSVNAANYNPDGKRIATASSDKTAIVWDAQSFQIIRKLEKHADMVESAEYCHENGAYIITASRDGTAKIWDARTFEDIDTLKCGRVQNACYNPDNCTSPKRSGRH